MTSFFKKHFRLIMVIAVAFAFKAVVVNWGETYLTVKLAIIANEIADLMLFGVSLLIGIIITLRILAYSIGRGIEEGISECLEEFKKTRRSVVGDFRKTLSKRDERF